MKRTLWFLTLSGLLACTPANVTKPSTANIQPAASNSPQTAPVAGGSLTSTTPSAPSASIIPNSNAENEPSTPAVPVDSTASVTDTSDLQALQLQVSKRFFSESGEQVQLIVKDQNGNPIAPERLKFVSLRPQDFSVDAMGNVRALISEGFATIRISVNGSSLSAEQLFSVSNPSGGSSGGSESNIKAPPTQEKVNGQIEFQF